MTAESGETRVLDDATREAAVAAVEAAKAAGWTQAELRAWFDGRGVELSEYLAAKRGEAVRWQVAGTLAMVAMKGLERDTPPDDFPDIPSEMKATRRWLVWRAEPVEDGKPRKVPYYVSGRPRGRDEWGAKISLDSPEDVAQLVSYDDACAALRGGNYTGLGFALGEDRDRFWQGIDLDDLANHPGLDFLVREGLPGYLERSPSGKGMHAIGFGRYFRSLGSNISGIEAYSGGRYFTVTGESQGMGSLTCLADYVEKRLAPLHSERPQDTSKPDDGHGSGAFSGAFAVKELRSALASLRADDYHLWIRMGLALKGLGEQGRALWIEWSQSSDKFRPEDAKRWDTFEPGQITYRSVFSEAQAAGWANPGTGGGGSSPQGDGVGSTDADPDKPKSAGPFRASDLSGEPPERQWIVPEWIVEGAVNSLYGDGGVGKTLLAQQLACAVSMGAPWLGLPTKQGTVLAVLCEDEKDELHRRHNHIKAAMGHPITNPFCDVWLWPRVGDENVIVRWNKDGAAVLADFYADVVRRVEEVQPSLLILDTLADVYGGNEIDRPQVNYFVKTVLGGLIKKRAALGSPLTILLLGHPSVAGKASGSGYSGSTAWNNAVRARMYLEKPKGAEDAPAPPDERILTRGKANYAASGDETAVRLFFADGVLRACEDAEDGDSVLWGAKEEAVRLVGRAWSTSHPYTAQRSHKRYIHVALVADMARGGFGAQIARQAIRELISDDRRIVLSRTSGARGYKLSDGGK